MDRYQFTKAYRVEYKKILTGVIYPEIPASTEDYYVITTGGDRFDILSKQFYGDEKYWWALAAANPHVRRDTLSITTGQQLRVPPFNTILEVHERTNTLR